MDTRPIGVFDSGLGGLTVVRQLLEQLPGEDIVYFGDTGRVPYGTRSRETIEKYARQDCRFLLGKDVKQIIAACGTVSSTALHVLEGLPVPACGVVEATAAAAVKASRSGRIGVMGTSATIRSGAFPRRIETLRPGAQVFSAACSMLIPLVENGWIDPDDEVARAILHRYLAPLKAEGVDTLILGCTHFPLLAPLISAEMGETVRLIDSGQETAAACAAALAARQALNPTKKRGSCRFYVSDRVEGFSQIAHIFLGREVEDDVEMVELEAIDHI